MSNNAAALPKLNAIVSNSNIKPAHSYRICCINKKNLRQLFIQALASLDSSFYHTYNISIFSVLLFAFTTLSA